MQYNENMLVKVQKPERLQTPVDRVIDAASNTFRVRAELPNANSAIPSGLRCRAEIAGVAAALAPPASRDATPKPLAQSRIDARPVASAVR